MSDASGRLAVLLIATASYAYTCDMPSITLLVNQNTEKAINGGDTHRYLVSAPGSQTFVHLSLDQRGIDLVAKVFAPDGQLVRSADWRWHGPETVSFTASQSGGYCLHIVPLHSTARGGRYRLVLRPPRPFSAADQDRIAAEAASTEIKTLVSKGTAEALKSLIELIAEAERLWRNVGDEPGQAQAVNTLGFVQNAMSQNRTAIKTYERALNLWRSAGDRSGEAETLHNTGAAYSGLGDRKRAGELYESSIPIARDEGNTQGEASSLTNLSVIHLFQGRYGEGLKLLETALPLWRAVGDQNGIIQALNNLGGLYFLTGEPQRALEYLRQALEIIEPANLRGRAYVLLSLGRVYDELGDSELALNYTNQALPLMIKSADKRGTAGALTNIGSVNFSRGSYRAAIDYYEQAASIARSVEDRWSESMTLVNKARAEDALGDTSQAIEYNLEALSISRDLSDARTQATALHNLAMIAYRSGDRRRAIDQYRQALPLWEASGHHYGWVNTMLGVARAERELGNLEQSRTIIESAIDAVESLRTKVASRDLRASYFASKQEFYELYVDILMDLHQRDPGARFDILALEASDRARARSLLEGLNEVRADLRSRADAELLEQERRLQRDVNARAARLAQIEAGKNTEVQRQIAKKNLEEGLAALRELEGEIRLSSPRYAALTQPSPVNAEEIRSQLADTGTILLEFQLNEDRSFVWAVTAKTIEVHELPPRKQIEAAAVRLLQESYNPPDARDPPEALRRFRAAAREVSRMLLGPIANLTQSNRLVIVGEGLISKLPFAALPIPSEDALLASAMEIVKLPSASAIGLLRHDLADRKLPPFAVAVFADPIFDERDSRARRLAARGRARPGPAVALQQVLLRSAREAGVLEQGREFVRLPFTRREALKLAALRKSPDVQLFLDASANRKTATSARLRQYRNIHFATHAFVNEQHPGLSGLVLSAIDEQGRPQDGFLRLHDIYNLDLPVELVVLSACQTGLGKEVRGEGLISLTRGFLYAGAARVLVSLWKVSDEATAELMGHFYRRMLVERMQPSRALAAAQNDLRRNPRWKHPYYWAGFTLYGEWR